MHRRGDSARGVPRAATVSAADRDGARPDPLPPIRGRSRGR
jgi:hypothetical protein